MACPKRSEWHRVPTARGRVPRQQPSRGSAVRLRCLLILVAGLSWGLGGLLRADDAPAEDQGPASDPSYREEPIPEAVRQHWSFRPLRRPPLPDRVSDPDWARNAIDLFVLQQLDQRRQSPQPPADRHTLIRRVTFDLTGLPPTPAEVQAFVSDPRDDAYPRLVERLLASPAHGEHLAQFWLDLARFAESDGFEHDKVRPDAWRYRDWVIAALNRDLPYDQFVQWQLAGDLLAPESSDARTATAFCLAGPDMPDVNSQEERRHNLLNELTATVGSALLGLQFGCAQCHDHKYDPISLADFYRLRAVFAPAVHVKKDQSVGYLNEVPDADEPAYVYLRGDWRRPGPRIEPGFPRIASTADQAPGDAAVAGAELPRLALARWLTRHDHPLTSRVIANRLWQQHFGRGLSESASDLGLMGDEPAQPELLDWLASELIRRDYSLKSLHRLIVTSATYCQAGNPRRRLTGEMLRDAMFAVSGTLDRRAGGPGVLPPLPPELVATLLKNQWNESPRAADHYRRSVYVFARRNLRYPIFEAFDRPDANASCARRPVSTTAPQALLLLNSAQSLDAARRLAGTALEAAGDSREATIGWLYWRALARPARPDELAAADAFLEQQTRLIQQQADDTWRASLPVPCPPAHQSPAAAAVTDLCLALLNSNEFLYVD
ncbi:MAG: DUF1549 domain-containing protein [Pirellulaceae bacterium]|nr:DUF1549 domain-containing protein [Pirellulaceae bacterium]